MVGAIASVWRLRRGGAEPQLFALLCLGTFIAAMIYLSLGIASFSTIKASYTLSLVTCYAVLFAEGCAQVSRWRFSRAVLNGVMACWALSVYAGYFVWATR